MSTEPMVDEQQVEEQEVTSQDDAEARAFMAQLESVLDGRGVAVTKDDDGTYAFNGLDINFRVGRSTTDLLIAKFKVGLVKRFYQARTRGINAFEVADDIEEAMAYCKIRDQREKKREKEADKHRKNAEEIAEKHQVGSLLLVDGDANGIRLVVPNLLKSKADEIVELVAEMLR